MTFFTGKSPINYEQKCLCTLVLDVSGSMSGMAIDELNAGLKAFQESILNDYIATQRLEISIITFGNKVQIIQEADLAEYVAFPKLLAGGSTPLVDAMRIAIHNTELRKLYYRTHGVTYYRPMVVLITDGEPDPDQDTVTLKSEIQEMSSAGKMTFFAIAVQNANMKVLSDLMPDNYPPRKLQGLNFSEFFKWLSASVKMVSASRSGDRIQLPAADGWSDMSV